MPRDERPVTVFETSDPGVLAVVKSLLEDADIPYFAAGENFQSLFPGGFNAFAGPVRMEVSPDDARRARELLAPLDCEPPDGA
jgi:hypothetical protein